MIKTDELRIGNKFKGMGMVQTVFEIIDNSDRGKLEYVSDFQKEGYKYLITCVENGNQYKPIEINPIPLTVKILIKSGFKRLGDGTFYYGELNEFNKRDIYLFRVAKHGICYNDYQHPIKSVHQLQNLYRALNNKELIIKGLNESAEV